MLILTDHVVFVMVDIQEKFKPHIQGMERVIKNASILNKATEILDLPLIITEQNPKGLGHTIEDIYIPTNLEKFEKTRFSIFDQRVEDYIKSLNRNTVILYGIESHICILQSALEAIEKKIFPIIVEDAVSSISSHNKEISLKRIRHEGGMVVTTEMLLFELIKDAVHPNFKEISNLIKFGV